MHSCPFIHFYTPPLKSAGYYGIPSVQKCALSVRPSVRPSDRPSVIISFPLSILSIFQPILFKLYIRTDVGEEWLWIIDGSLLSSKHRDIALYVENSFWCSILANYFINFLQSLNWSRFKDLGLLWDCKSFNFVKQYRVTALDLKKKR